MKHKLAYIVVAVLAFAAGAATFYFTDLRPKNKYIEFLEKSCAAHIQCHQAAMDMLHIFYEDSTATWSDLEKTESYRHYDELVEHDWEDFFYNPETPE